jgi:hypothetical protein
MQTTVASISARFAYLVVEFFSVGFLGFGGCAAWVLVARSDFFQQPPTTRIGVLDAAGLFENS